MAASHGDYEHRFAATAWFGIEGTRVSWSGVFAGVAVALGVGLLLAALGSAVGIAAVEPGSAGSGAAGMRAEIWRGVELAIGLFVGGMVATRAGAIVDRATGFFEGVIVWVMYLMLTAYLAGSGLAVTASGITTLLGGATGTFGAIVSGPGDGDGSDRIDIPTAVDGIVSRLRSAELVNHVASATGMSVNETRTRLDETAARVEASAGDPQRAGEEARRGIASLFERARSGALAAAPAGELRRAAAASAWLTFAALLSTLAATCAGAMYGRYKAATALAPPT